MIMLFRGPVSWIYPPEFYPLRERGKAVALAISAKWAFKFDLGESVMTLRRRIFC